MSIDRALDALLHRRSARDALARGDLAALGIDETEAAHLRAIDPEQLERMARLVRDAVFGRSHLGTGSLAAAFPRTISAWLAAHAGATVDDLAAELLESPSFALYRASADDDLGICVEEAFFRFASDANIGDPTTRFEEVMEAVIGTLAITPAPAFIVPDFVKRTPHGWLAIAPGPCLVATARDRIVRGPITPFLADLLTSAAPPPHVAARHGVGAEELEATLAELSRLGLKPEA